MYTYFNIYILIDVVVLQSWPASVCVQVRAYAHIHTHKYLCLITCSWKKISVWESNFRNEQSPEYNYDLSKPFLAVELTKLCYRVILFQFCFL